MTNTISPIEGYMNLKNSVIELWIQKRDLPILWISGDCGTGKTHFIKQLRLYMHQLGYVTSYRDFLGCESHVEYLNQITLHLNDSKPACLLLDNVESVENVQLILRERLLLMLPWDMKIVIASRKRALGGWSESIWSKLMVSIEIRPLGIKEALRLLHHDSKEQVIQGYIASGGRFSFFVNKAKQAPDKIIDQFLSEAKAVKQKKLLNRACYLWRFDRQILKSIADNQDVLDMGELSGLSFIKRSVDGFRIDPLLKTNLRIAGQRPGFDLTRDMIWNMVQEPGIIKQGYLLTLLELVTPQLNELFDERLPFCWKLDKHSNELESFNGDLHSSTDVILQFRLVDPEESTVGFMVLSKKCEGSPYILTRFEAHPLLKNEIINITARKILSLCILGEHILVPLLNESLCRILISLNFKLIPFQNGIGKGEAVSCEFTVRGIIPWLEDMVKNDAGIGNNYKDTVKIDGEILRRDLRYFYDNNKLLQTKLACILGDRYINVPKHVRAEKIRKIIRDGIFRLEPEQKYFVQFIFKSGSSRNDLARTLGISERSLYRRIKSAVDELGEVISKGINIDKGGE